MSSRKEQKEQARKERIAAEQAAAAAASRGRRMKIIGGAVGGAAIVVVAAVLISLGGSQGNKVTGADEVAARLAGIPQNGITLGKPDAPVTIIEFADLKCPFCRNFAKKAFPTIVKDYVKTGKVKMEFRNLTFVGEASAPGDSRDAATAAGAAGLQGKLWNFADLFYINQKDELTRFATDEWLRKIGTSIPGLDVEKMMSERNKPAISSQLDEAQTKFDDAGFNGTPSFMIGKTGEKPEELPYTSVDKPDEFTAAIDELLK
ncbi:MAG: thioredoxin domain-containing protein [Actinobacteria bacterium]|nr:thioredoxin domain-containing protein [Actinomycetota bacterium]